MRELASPRDAGIEGVEAWNRSLAQPHATWMTAVDDPRAAATVQGRLASGIAVAHVEPKFALRTDDVFFCIGSCFARSIEEHLLYRDMRVSSLGIPAAPSEAPHRLSGLINKFTTASMLNELHWSLEDRTFPEAAFVEEGGGVHDLQLFTSGTVTLERARERRRDIHQYFRRLREATVVIITLGLVEIWYDRSTGLYLNVTPTLAMTRRYPGRFSVHVSDYRENRERLEGMCDVLATYGHPNLRIIVTVSPVPLHRTFAADDVLTANGYSKATLRAVAGDVAAGRANVQYFPSYEMVTVTARERAFLNDELHVRDEMVEAVTNTFLRVYGIDRTRPHPEFQESLYLRANPDVRAAVAERRFGSGYEHWLLTGRSESRPLRP